MPVPATIVRMARHLWYWQWKILMTGLAPADKDGNYVRPKANFLQISPQTAHLEEKSRYTLIVGRSCPWAHRAWLVWIIRNLRETINVIIVEPDRKRGKWRFVTPFNGCRDLYDLYLLCGSPKSQRATVPVIFNQKEMTIICNESAQIIELLNNWPASMESPELMPFGYQKTIEKWRELVQFDINDGVYKCGFARQQSAYTKASATLFEALGIMEENLNKNGPWLCGPHLTLSDICLFPTLIRWELVYAPLFNCNRQLLWQFPSIWQWRQRFFSLPGVADTCDSEAMVSDYFGSLFPLNPSRIVPDNPSLASLVLSLIPDPRHYE
ncbi:Glutathione S-transferase C terminus protein (chromatophore) [Paulinella micropora]|uniref:Glutathione S-transferase C terminus protein n=1 Tax=Paulinella micropora TaxID=1928728 RepID=A0A1L5YCL3_9EUKA|nr:hypothetical protein PCKR_670 [Paulinella micropora]AQX45204.1 hypothetical protein PFK_670 [Paulinella micropora]BBL86422.1 Glutathione S-transferase C terminus protein [Paulinella micropora]